MPAKFALETLFDAVKPLIETTFTVNRVKRVNVEWGRTRTDVQLNQGVVGRVLIVPGNLDGDLGELGGPGQWEHPAKALLDLGMLFQVYAYGHDPVAGVEQDRAQDRMGWLVLHETIRQLKVVSQRWPEVTSPVTFRNPKLVKPLSKGTLGREYLMICSVEQPILDMFDDQLPYTDEAPGVADITDHLGDRAEHSTTREIL